MKVRITILLLSVLSTCINAQVITYDDFKSILPYIQKEDFKSAYDQTNHILQNTVNDSSDLRGLITYMNIYSAAGMAFVDQMTREDFGKHVKQLVGQKLVMPGHPCIDSTKRSFNSLTFQRKGDEFQGFSMASNSAKTCIFCFEYYKFALPITPSDYIGKNIRCKGILEGFEVSDGPLKTWITRLHISKADINLFVPK
jgi:hypothetical protein